MNKESTEKKNKEKDNLEEISLPDKLIASLKQENKYKDLTDVKGESISSLSVVQPLAIFIHGKKFLFANKVMKDITGYSIDELYSMSINDILHPDSEEFPLIEDMDTDTDEDEVRSYERKILSKGGMEKWVECISVPVEYDGEEAFLVAALNITNCVKSRENLMSKREEVGAILDSLVEHVIHSDRNMKIIWANKSAVESVNLTREELIGRYCYSVWEERDEPCPDCPVIKAMETGKPEEIEKVTPDGRMWHIRGYPETDSDGNIVGGIELTLDITEEKKKKKEVELQKTYFQQLFDNSPDAIAMIDINDRVLRVNKGFERLFQYRQDDIWGKPMKDLVVSEPYYEEADNLLQEILKRKSVHRETKRIKKDGSTVDVALTGYPIIIDDNLVGIYAVYRDISRRKEIERKLKDSLDKVQKALSGTVKALAVTVEKRDLYTAGHQQRVAKLACAIGDELKLSDDRLNALRIASILHDIGKIHIAAEILTKPDELNQIEMSMVKTHPRVGYDILKSIEFPGPVAEIVLQHHERLDGSGYPEGLKGDEILIEARILGVSDVVEAMSSRRPYRKALDVKTALQEIEENKNILYDSEVVDACLFLFREKGFSLEGKLIDEELF